MRFKRVFFVNPHIPESYLGSVRPPTGLGYLAEYLGANGVASNGFDMMLKNSFPRLQARVRDFKPDLIGVTVFSFGFRHAFALTGRIKESFSEIPIIIGGPHVSVTGPAAMEETAADFACMGEGEELLLALCRGDAAESIPGLIRHDNGRAAAVPCGAPATDLDRFPFPRYAAFAPERYFLREAAIISSRGCPYRCIYCSVGLTSSRNIRVRSVENVLDEMRYWHGRGFRTFQFLDDNFTFHRDRVEALCREILRGGPHGIEMRLGNGIRADRVDSELLTLMKRAGFHYIGIGVEAGNDRVLGALKKGEKMESIRRAVRDACDLGFDVALFFIIGAPGETEADVRESFRIAEEFPVLIPWFYNLIPYPGTELYDWALRNNYFVKDPAEYLNDASYFVNDPVFETPELPAALRRRLFAEGERIRKRVFKASVRRRLRRFGALAGVLSALAVSDIVQNLIRRNALVRAAAEFFRSRTRNPA